MKGQRVCHGCRGGRAEPTQAGWRGCS